MVQFKGRTSDAQCPILGASFWKKGVKVTGTITKQFDTANGICSEITLITPMKVGESTEKKVAVGNMAGFHMALNAAGLETLQLRDRVVIECTGSTPTTKGSNRVDFTIAVDRPD